MLTIKLVLPLAFILMFLYNPQNDKARNILTLLSFYHLPRCCQQFENSKILNRYAD